MKLEMELQHRGVLLESDSRLPSVASLIVGGPIKGSWWGHPLGHAIFAAAQKLADHPDVLVVKLVCGKVTYIHRKLWPALLAVARSGEPWQMAGLGASARSLHSRIGREGSLRTDGLARSLAAGGRLLEQRLLVHGEAVHTERGAHARCLESWDHWARRARFKRNYTVDKPTERGRMLASSAATSLVCVTSSLAGQEVAAIEVPFHALAGPVRKPELVLVPYAANQVESNSSVSRVQEPYLAFRLDAECIDEVRARENDILLVLVAETFRGVLWRRWIRHANPASSESKACLYFHRGAPARVRDRQSHLIGDVGRANLVGWEWWRRAYFKPRSFGAMQRVPRHFQCRVDVQESGNGKYYSDSRSPSLDSSGARHSSVVRAFASFGRRYRWPRRIIGWACVAAGLLLFHRVSLGFVLGARTRPRLILLDLAATITTQFGTALLLLDVVDLELLCPSEQHHSSGPKG